MRWSDALADAPWPVTLIEPFHEKQFRRAYAARLVQRGAAVPAIANTGSSGPSGQSKLLRRTFRMTAEEFAATDAKAEAAKLPWNTWMRRKVSQ